MGRYRKIAVCFWLFCFVVQGASLSWGNGLIPIGKVQWQGSVGVQEYQPLGQGNAEFWIDATESTDGSLTLKRSETCPDWYPWPALRSDAFVLDIIKTPYLYYDFTCEADEDRGFWLSLMINDGWAFFMPTVEIYEDNRIDYIPGPVDQLIGAGRYRGRLDILAFLMEHPNWQRIFHDGYIPDDNELIVNITVSYIDISLHDESGSVTVTINALYFGDDGDGHLPLVLPSGWARAGVEEAMERGLTAPSALHNVKSILRREVCAELLVAAYERLYGPIRLPIALADQRPGLFDDTANVDATKMAYLGIMTGTGTRRFDPGGDMTREQWAVILHRLLAEAQLETVREDLYYQDAGQIASWATEAVDFVSRHGIMEGSGGRFMPKEKVTCEQAIVSILRMAKMMEGW